MNVFTIPSAREPVVHIDPNTGKAAFSRTWFLFFQQIFNRVGGASSPGIDDLEQLSDESSASRLDAAIYSLSDELRAAPQPLLPQAAENVVANEIGDVRAELAELRKAIEGIQQGVVL